MAAVLRIQRFGYVHWLRVLLVAMVIISAACTTAPKVEKKPKKQGYAFWPAYPDEPRIQFLTSYRYSSDVEEPTSALEDLIYGKSGPQVLPISKPYGVEMWEGKIYVCDPRNQSVIVLDIRNKQTKVIGTTGFNILRKPVDIAIASDGMKYIADISRNIIYVFDADDRPVTSFSHGDFQPLSLAVSGNKLYVCDKIKQRVEILDRKTGKVIDTIGEPGDEDGKFILPLGVAVDSTRGEIVVTDVMRCRVQRLNDAGEVSLGLGKILDAPGSFVRPKHVEVDREGNIYVVDASFANVQIFDTDGQLLTFFGSAGGHPGAMYLPAGIAVHEGDMDLFEEQIHPAFEPKRLLIVTNQFGPNKVSVYALGQLRPGKTAEDIRTSRVEVSAGVRAPDDDGTMPLRDLTKSVDEPKPQTEQPADGKQRADQPAVEETTPDAESPRNP